MSRRGYQPLDSPPPVDIDPEGVMSSECRRVLAYLRRLRQESGAPPLCQPFPPRDYDGEYRCYQGNNQRRQPCSSSRTHPGQAAVPFGGGSARKFSKVFISEPDECAALFDNQWSLGLDLELGAHGDSTLPLPRAESAEVAPDELHLIDQIIERQQQHADYRVHPGAQYQHHQDRQNPHHQDRQNPHHQDEQYPHHQDEHYSHNQDDQYPHHQDRQNPHHQDEQYPHHQDEHYSHNQDEQYPHHQDEHYPHHQDEQYPRHQDVQPVCHQDVQPPPYQEHRDAQSPHYHGLEHLHHQENPVVQHPQRQAVQHPQHKVVQHPQRQAVQHPQRIVVQHPQLQDVQSSRQQDAPDHQKQYAHQREKQNVQRAEQQRSEATLRPGLTKAAGPAVVPVEAGGSRQNSSSMSLPPKSTIAKEPLADGAGAEKQAGSCKILLLCLAETKEGQESIVSSLSADGRFNYTGLFLFYGDAVQRTVLLSQSFALNAMRESDFRASLLRLLASKHIQAVCCTNVKSLCHLMFTGDGGGPVDEDFLCQVSERVYDLPQAHFLLEPDRPLDDVRSLLLHYQICEAGPAPQALTEQAFLIGRLWMRLEARLRQAGMLELFARLEAPLVPLVFLMEHGGIWVDRGRLAALRTALDEQLSDLRQKIYQASGESFCINSPLQLKKVVFDRLRLHERLSREDAEHSGLQKALAEQSTRQEVLLLMSPHHPLPGLVVAYRKVGRLVSACCDGYREFIDADGRIRPVWDQRSAVTGRLYSSLPNLQGIPKLGEELAASASGQRTSVRACFSAPPGRRLLSIDFSHVELRIFAHLAGDARLRAAFAAGSDVFADLARVCLPHGPPGQAAVAEVSHADRSIIKRLVYATLYGACERKLTEILSSAVSIGEVQRMCARLQTNWPAPFDYFRRVTATLANGNGSVTTLMGRRRAFHELASPSPALRSRAMRQAVNFTIQGSAADICKLAMLRCWDAARAAGLDARLVIHLHDELIWEVAEGQAVRATAVLAETMESLSGAAGLSVPLRVRTRCDTSLLFGGSGGGGEGAAVGDAAGSVDS